MEAFLETLASILTFFASAYINVIGFFSTLLQDKNYIALAAIAGGIIFAGVSVGLVKRKLQRSR